jgi:hypothetical protein
MMCVYLHTKTFEYIIVLILLKFVTQKQRISCKNKCPALKNDGFQSIEIGKEDIGSACVGLYKKIKERLGKYEVNFFIKVLVLVSDGKCTILQMNGGRKKQVMNQIITGPRGGKYTMIHGKKRYL